MAKKGKGKRTDGKLRQLALRVEGEGAHEAITNFKCKSSLGDIKKYVPELLKDPNLAPLIDPHPFPEIVSEVSNARILGHRDWTIDKVSR